MKTILSSLRIQVNDKIYLKDPESSVLGKKIIKEGILLIDEIGFDCFTFKKLGAKIGSNESSLYRYFENKHKFLVYLSSWYWSWIEYKMLLATTNVTCPMEQLLKAIAVITEKIKDDDATLHVNESILNKIIIAEFTKTFLTKEVDEENREGFFTIYKRIINRMVDIVTMVDPEYPYPKSLVSNIVEGGLHQHFLRDHLQTITNCNEKISPTDYYSDLVKRVLKH
ncbi:TetR family transcriptional regulator [Flavobacterium suaedae]|uniref:TetR family transcriptional regulator n=1 Tax=Flavobacterium suaedae TaxID=1767027 RepID=A0ABQ1JFD4_9FLAO|nr:TetR/AcrR family transcriptional regulator [Flavobacterium suaedae]GGB67100.1 TetR family transcriptional regulator [Flavobacterium suaedae]